MNKEIDAYIDSAPADHSASLAIIRKLVHDAVPGTEENMKWGRPVFSAPKDFAYLKLAKSYVTLGFFQAEKIKDPKNLLEGTGKSMRHIKIKKAGDIDHQLLKQWLKEAAR